MGQESKCRLDYAGAAYEGKALLETSELIFRGDTRIRIPFNQMSQVKAENGRLHITFKEGQATLHLGATAEKWARKILNPPSRLDKLGVKSGTRIRWIGTPDSGFKQEAIAFGAVFIRTRPDLTFLHASTPTELDILKETQAPIWVVYRKGAQQLREIDVLNGGRNAGLVDIKVASFSPTHTALKFVYPRG